MHHFSCERGPNLIRDGAARVGVGLPGRPCCTVKPRQQGLDFPETVPIVLAWASPQGLVLPSSHANKDRNFPCRRRPCWRGPSRKSLLHRQATPTGARFSSAGAVPVGVGLPARPCFTVDPRQQEPDFPVPAPPVLAWTFPQGLVSPSIRANRSQIFPFRRRPCWRGPPWKALLHRQSAPTGAGFSRGRNCCPRINPSAFSGNFRTLWCLPSR